MSLCGAPLWQQGLSASELHVPLANRGTAMNDKSHANAQRERFAELLSGGAILSSAEFQRRMGWSADDVTRAELERRIFSLESGSVRAYPAFYTDQTYAREQLEAITIALADLPGGSKWIFFTLPKGSLATPGGPTEDEREEGNARTPLEALSHGDFEAVMVAAAGYYER